MGKEQYVSGREEGRRVGEIDQPSGYPGQIPLEMARMSSPRSIAYTAASPRCPAGGARGAFGSTAKYSASTGNEQAGMQFKVGQSVELDE